MVDTPKTDLSVRLLAVKLLSKTENSGRYIDHLLETSEAVQHLTRRDHGLLQQIVNGVLQHKTYLDLVAKHYIQKGFASFPSITKNIFRTAFYQLMFLQRIPAYAVVSESVKVAKKVLDQRRAKFVNAVLRSYLKKPFTPNPPKPKKLKELAQYYSHPLWLVERFIEQYGNENIIEWLQGNNQIPPLYVRLLQANLPVGATEVLEAFEPVKPYFKYSEGESPTLIPGWDAGAFLVQDPAAGLVVQIADAQPGESVIDFCAAPGGKAIALAHNVGADGVVIAVEKSPLRAEKLRINLARTGLQNTSVVVGDARSVKVPTADVVLLDAPCSGLGVLSRRADLRWQRAPEDFAELVTLQRDILNHVAQFVVPGGRLVYATCSIDHEENESVAAAFLQAHPKFELENAAEFVAEHFVTEQGYLKTLPHLHGIDGVFAARFRKANDKPLFPSN